MHASPGARVIVGALIAVAIQFVLDTAYAWPAARLARKHPAAFDVTRMASPAAALQVITGRRAYGAIVRGGMAPQVLTASAASPAVVRFAEAQAQ